MTSSQTSSPLAAAPGLLAQGKFDEATVLAQGVLGREPDNADARHLLGVIALNGGNYADAARLIEAALLLKPEMVSALYNHGTALMKLKRYEEALASLDKTLALRPSHVEALVNRAIAIQNLGRVDEALRSLDAALAANPNLFEAHLARGNALIALRRWQQADVALTAALNLQPGSAAALNSRGVALVAKGRYLEARAFFDAALKIDPNFLEALGNRARTSRYLGRLTDARRDYQQLMKQDPGRPEIETNVVLSQLALCDWSFFETLLPRAREGFRTGPAHLSPFEGCLLLTTAEEQAAYTRKYAVRHFSGARAALSPPRSDKIRLAYISGDFYEHAVAQLIVGILESHDRARFHVTAVALGESVADSMGRRVEAAVARFVIISDPDDVTAAQRLRGMDFDIAVDLQGYTRNNRPGLFAQGVAPIQVNYLGYPGTMGAAFMDYVIADSFLIPPGQEAHYNEAVVRLPGSYQPNDRQRAIGAAVSRAQCGLPHDAFVFCCFNGNQKISATWFGIWMRLLAAKSGSVLWLFEGHPESAANLRREAAARGIDPARLIFASHVPPHAHLARHAHADLFLDTLPYNAHTTMSDCLWAGVPAITCAGETFAGRVSGSLLTAVGLSELITTSAGAYEALANQLAHDPARLAAIRAKLAANRLTTFLFDTTGTTRHLEAAFRRMWERHRDGRRPEPMTVLAGAGAES